MSHRAHGSSRLAVLLAAAVALALALALPAHAAAAAWGELERFGEKGTGVGQLEGAEYAFGVDQSDGGLWVVDTVKEGTRFRIQKFMKSGGKYKVVASATFKPKDPGSEEEDEVEGVAFDPSMKRAYVLVSESRPPAKKRPDQFAEAAAELYAFSTETNAGEIVPATGAGAEGLLAGTEVLEPLSDTYGVSLLEPGGIAVDPVSHDVVIPGYVDRGKKLPASEGTAAVEELTPEGKLGSSKWVDETDFFEECECVNSPVVTPTGQIYVVGQLDEIDEIPQNLSDEPPKQVFAFECESCTFIEELTEFPGENPEHGSQMALGPEGNFYVRARIKLASEENFKHGGVLVLSPTFTELGWTGGNTQASPTQACSVYEEFSSEPVLAAGTEPETVYVLQRLKREPRIIKLGAGGTGCPTASATKPTAKSGGVEVEPVGKGENVTLSSTLTQANALSVEWEFGDGTPTQTVSTREQQTTAVQHKFTKTGTLTITEKIHTDDLASPLIEVKRSLNVVGPPTVGSGEAKPVTGSSSVVVSGTVDPNGKETECKFEYWKVSEGESHAIAVSGCTLAHREAEEEEPVSGTISGLAPHVEYDFRIWAKNADGEKKGNAVSLTTGPPPSAVTEAASAVTHTTATLNGKVNPEDAGSPTCQFEYGPKTSYGTKVPCPSALKEAEATVAEAAPISGLTAGSTYHFRVVITVGGGTSYYGEDKTFATEAEKTTTTTTPITTPTGTTEVLGTSTSKPPPPASPVPVVTIASTSLSVSSSGAFSLKLSCPGNESSCSATITVKTLGAVLASSAKKKAILTLASGTITLTGSSPKALTLHLSSKARSLLAHMHVLRARVTIVAHDPQGGAHTTVTTVTLRLAKAHHH